MASRFHFGFSNGISQGGGIDTIRVFYLHFRHRKDWILKDGSSGKLSRRFKFGKTDQACSLGDKEKACSTRTIKMRPVDLYWLGIIYAFWVLVDVLKITSPAQNLQSLG